MKCPHCQQSLGEKYCPACNSAVLEDSLFCHRCGVPINASPSISQSGEKEENDFSNRILCSDGTCIGVIDDKGFCKVCGKPYAGDAQ
jgi:hypothetical protein